MLRTIRLIFATVSIILISLLFLDFTGTLHSWFGWLAHIQFIPALLAINIGIVLLIVVLTWVFGRIYCSIICPLGILQDVIAWIKRKLFKRKKSFYSYSPEKKWLRYGVLILFIAVMVAGFTSLAALIDPYSAYGRIANNIFQPIWLWCNNGLALLSERIDSYMFYETDVWLKSLPTFIIAIATLIIITILAAKGGRTYCNTICPVGTLLGLISRYSLFRIRIDESKCNGCKQCSRHCKASCIDTKFHKVDLSRCVTCMDCIGHCHQDAISYTFSWNKSKPETTNKPENRSSSRRTFFMGLGLAAGTSFLKAQEKKVDGGLAPLLKRELPRRTKPIVPAGAQGARHFAQHCTACQLCVSVCPNQVLRPSTDLEHFIQPEMSYERGYCRPECVKCSEVCPSGAIKLVDRAEKASTKIGTAVWIRTNCITITHDRQCDNCARHCPTGAIQMVPDLIDDELSPKIPVIDAERCIGCGACESLCPARPYSAIYVNGIDVHHTI